MEVIESRTYTYRTPLGEGFLLAEEDGTVTVYLPGSERPGELERAAPEGETADVLDYLEAYFRGENNAGWHGLNALLERAGMSGFSRRVMEAVAEIPFGETRSYAEVAAAASSPRAARAVGNVMARNPLPVLVPCHRVIKSTGEPGGFGGDTALKVWMLEMEKRALC